VTYTGDAIKAPCINNEGGVVRFYIHFDIITTDVGVGCELNRFCLRYILNEGA